MPEKISPIRTLKSLLRPFRHFPVTLGTIWLFTLVLVCGISIEEWDISDILEWFTLFLFYFGSGSFLVESFFLQRKRDKWYGLALAADLFIAALLFFLSRIYDHESWSSGFSTAFIRYTISYFLILFFLSVWLCYRHFHHTIEAYLVFIFGRAVRYHLIWFLLVIGSSIILSIMDTLFAIGAYWDFQMQIQMLLFGFYYMTAFLLSFYPEGSEESVLTGVLVKYILSGMVLTAFTVVYVYMLKILILLEIPSNSIFRITGQLFILGIPVCLMASCYKENNPLYKAVRFLPYLFLPFLPLQIYSISIRIWENGITPLRYAGVAFLLFECLFFILYHFRRSILHILLLCLSAFILIGGCLPYINMNDISCLSQSAVIDRFFAMTPAEQQQILAVPDSSLSDDSAENEKNKRFYQRICGAYSFLSGESLGEKYLATLNDSQIELLDTFHYYSEYAKDTQVHYHLSAYSRVIPVEGYRRCYAIEIASYRDSYDDTDMEQKKDVLADYPLILDDETQLTFHFDLDSLLRSYTNDDHDTEKAQEYFETHRIYEIDKDHTFYLAVLSFTIDTEKNTVTKYRAEGYLLEK